MVLASVMALHLRDDMSKMGGWKFISFTIRSTASKNEYINQLWGGLTSARHQEGR